MTSTQIPTAPLKREIFGWAMYDFANSGYTTVVLTAIFNTYFVGVIAGNDVSSGDATFLWTIAMAAANVLVLLTAPVIGAIADDKAFKKGFLAITTIGCVAFTALLSIPGPGQIAFAMCAVVAASFMFYTGENLVAAFIPEIATQEHMGRISALGWTIGYLGGLLTLGVCLAYIQYAQNLQQSAAQFVPATMLIVAIIFALASLPTFLWLRERAKPIPHSARVNYIKIGFNRVKNTFRHARRYRDLFRFLVTLTIYYAGINTVIVLAAIYAQEVMGFTTTETITMILVVNITAAIGAFVFGMIQDKLGAMKTLAITLCIWITASVLAYFSETKTSFWVVANLVGIALGSSQSAGRAIVGLFTPPNRAGEFFGLWGLATKFAAVIGPLSYGFITFITHGNHRIALLSTSVFFIAGLLGLAFINEQRGRQAALVTYEPEQV